VPEPLNVNESNLTKLAPKTKLVKAASILWGIAAAIFIIAVIWGGIIASNGADYAGLYQFVLPLFSVVLWSPLGIASFVLAIVSRAQHEGSKAWAVTLIVLNASPILLAFSTMLLFLVEAS